MLIKTIQLDKLINILYKYKWSFSDYNYNSLFLFNNNKCNQLNINLIKLKIKNINYLNNLSLSLVYLSCYASNCNLPPKIVFLISNNYDIFNIPISLKFIYNINNIHNIYYNLINPLYDKLLIIKQFFNIENNLYFQYNYNKYNLEYITILY